MLLRYALRELLNSKRFCILFLINLTLGLTGFIALDGVKRSFAEKLQSSAKNMLAADLTISSRKTLDQLDWPSIRRVLPPNSQELSGIVLYSMMSGDKKSILTELKAIDKGFPFYGQIVLQKQGIYDGKKQLELQEQAKVWVSPEIMLQLNVKIGDRIKIGSLEVEVSDVIEDDSSSTMIGASMAPRAYIGKKTLEQSGLLVFGSTATHIRSFKFPDNSDIDSIEQAVKNVLKDPSVRIAAYHKAGQDNGRMLGYLSDYLGLVALVALALSAIGASYLFRIYLDRKQASLAALVSMGLTHTRAMLIYAFQLAVLGVASGTLASLLGFALLPLFSKILSPLAPVQLELSIGWASMSVAIGLGALGSLLVCLPQLLRIMHLNPLILFQDAHQRAAGSTSTGLWTFIPSLMAFYCISVWQSHSWIVGSIFCGLLLATALLLGVVAWLGLKSLRYIPWQSNITVKLAVLNLRAHARLSMNTFLALGIGATLMNLIPQLQSSIQRELDRPEGDQLPSLFLFDIQEDQVTELSQVVASFQVQPKATAPMIMARLTQVNGVDWKRKDDDNLTREDEREERSRNRGVNLSYRMGLVQAETLVEGRLFQEAYQFGSSQPAELSIEQRFSERIGVKINDILTFDVQGLPITAKITSIRAVKWNTFEPNFFLVLQPGVLDDAPKTFLMTLPEMEDTIKTQLQNRIVEAFPNVSSVDVTKLVKKLNEIIQQMSFVLVVMGWLSVIAGHAVVFSISQNQALARRWDSNLLKILGTELATILKSALLEFGLIAFGAALSGAILGLATSYVASVALFGGVWSPAIDIPAIVSLALIATSLTTGFLAMNRILNERPTLALED